ncbi:molybdenum cofactor guanylyltransferase [Brevibacillus thermoruber]|uniref:molybdenum cofactor guanylyltransferase n=1 Tax=Brevibacillus thermoruber TaxID=33942 RepID=UPI004042E77D
MGVLTIGGVVLAGGQSSRMGRPKELLGWKGGTLIGHVVSEVTALNLPCLIVSNAPDRLPGEVTGLSGVSVTGDLVPSAGPISGIVTAFRVRREEALLVLSCDLPFADREQIGRLLAHAQRTEEWDVVAARTDGRLHPLFALYHRRTQPMWEEALRAGRHRLMEVLERLRIAETPAGLLDDWAAYNANTPEEYRKALAEQHAREAGRKPT